MVDKYIGVLEKGIDPKTGKPTNGNLGIVFELKEDDRYYGNNTSFSMTKILRDFKNGYLKEYEYGE